MILYEDHILWCVIKENILKDSVCYKESVENFMIPFNFLTQEELGDSFSHTNPKNEIGMEIHPFDQVIIIAQGNAKTILSDTDIPAHSRYEKKKNESEN